MCFNLPVVKFCNLLAHFAHSSLNLQFKPSATIQQRWAPCLKVSRHLSSFSLQSWSHSLLCSKYSLQDPSMWKENQILALWLKKNKAPANSVVHMHYFVLCFQPIINSDNRKFKTQQAQSTQAIYSNTTRKFCWSWIAWTDIDTDIPIEVAFTCEFSSQEDKEVPGKWHKLL